MKLNNKSIDLISKNLCLNREDIISILKYCKTVGDIVALDFGLKDKKLENNIKYSLVAMITKLAK